VSKQHDDNFLFSTVMQNGHNDLQIRSKLWVDVDGEPVFGKGRMLLLKAIGSTGFITQAAQAVSISYRRAWGYIKAMEERLGIQLVDCHAGGKNGGGASLTPDARSFLDKYEELDAGIRELVDKRFLEVFGNKRQEASNV
jgi:molybdate transport system regulatory protein